MSLTSSQHLIQEIEVSSTKRVKQKEVLERLMKKNVGNRQLGNLILKVILNLKLKLDSDKTVFF